MLELKEENLNHVQMLRAIFNGALKCEHIITIIFAFDGNIMDYTSFFGYPPI